jgi:hypothetical protein
MKRNSLYQITAAPRTPDYEATAPQIPVLSVLCPLMNLLNLPAKKFLCTLLTIGISRIIASSMMLTKRCVQTKNGTFVALFM